MGGVSDFQNVLKIKKFPIILGGGGKFKLGKVPKFSRFFFMMASLTLSVFITQKVALPNFGVALHHKSNRAISSSLATFYGVWRCRQVEVHYLLFIHLFIPKANAGVTLGQVGSWLSLVGFQVGPRLTDINQCHLIQSP